MAGTSPAKTKLAGELLPLAAARFFTGQPCALRERVLSAAKRVRVSISATLETAFDEPGEGMGAMADLVLFHGVHFAEGQGAPKRHEHRVVTETPVAPRRPDEPALGFAVEQLDMGV